MTPDEFATLIEELLVEAEEGGLPVEQQIEILGRIAKTMRDALGSP